MRVFLSAAHEARPYALPRLIAGFEAEVLPGVKEIDIEAIDTRKQPRGFQPEANIDPSDVPNTTIALVARPTGKKYRDLPWWEVVIK